MRYSGRKCSLSKAITPRRATLAGKVPVLTLQNQSAVSSLGFYVDCGSLYEAPEAAGVSHLMRLLSKRSNVYCNDWIAHLTLAHLAVTQTERAVDRRWNAYTLDGVAETLPQQASALWASVFLPRLEPFEISEELKYAENKLWEQRRADPLGHAFELLHQHAFRGSPLGNPAVIPDYNLKSLTQRDALDAYNAHFALNNLVVVGVNVDEDALMDALQNSEVFQSAISVDKDRPNPTVAPSAFVCGNSTNFERRADSFGPDYAPVGFSVAALGLKGSAHGNPSSVAALEAVKFLLTPRLRPSSGPFAGRVVINSSYGDAGLFAVLEPVRSAEDKGKALRAELEAISKSDNVTLEAAKKGALADLDEVAQNRRALMDLAVKYHNDSGIPNQMHQVVAALTPEQIKATAQSLIDGGLSSVFYGSPEHFATQSW